MFLLGLSDHCVAVLFGGCKLQNQRSSQPITEGWPTASAVVTGISDARLRSLDAAIRSEECKKIGSVRHGKLVYERYFDGDATTLRDTRSATKSITDILIGIAIDEH
jgi:hypothetical protein